MRPVQLLASQVEFFRSRKQRRGRNPISPAPQSCFTSWFNVMSLNMSHAIGQVITKLQALQEILLELAEKMSWAGDATLHYITLHYVTLHYITYITLHYITLHTYITLQYITLHYITLHYITLHYITLHYITLD